MKSKISSKKTQKKTGPLLNKKRKRLILKKISKKPKSKKTIFQKENKKNINIYENKIKEPTKISNINANSGKESEISKELLKNNIKNLSNEEGSELNKTTQDTNNLYQRTNIKKIDIGYNSNLIKINEINNYNNSYNSYNCKFPDKNENKKNLDKINSSYGDSEESNSSFNSSEDVESLGNIQLKRSNIKKKEIIIRKKESEDIISLEEAKALLENRDYKSLIKYKFPYSSQSEFNLYIYPINLRDFRKLLFSCPICAKGFRHYSMAYHIFQNHFEDIYKYLSERDIAKCCAILMQKEKEKIDFSLEIFTNLAILFKNCEFRGASQWREVAQKSIKEIKTLDIDRKYFGYSVKDVIQKLIKTLPLNKNKNVKRKYRKNKK